MDIKDLERKYDVKNLSEKYEYYSLNFDCINIENVNDKFMHILPIKDLDLSYKEFLRKLSGKGCKFVIEHLLCKILHISRELKHDYMVYLTHLEQDRDVLRLQRDDKYKDVIDLYKKTLSDARSTKH